MKNYQRIATFLTVILGSLGLMVVLLVSKARTPLARSFAPLFTQFGKSTKVIDNAVAHVLPLSDDDEVVMAGIYGERSVDLAGVNGGGTRVYLGHLIAKLTSKRARKFDYSVATVLGRPNAFALPGGRIMVTSGLLDIVDSEAELAFVLAHEIGHSELRHVSNLVKFELAAGKLGVRDLGKVGDLLNSLVLHSSFSKTEEMEADDYGIKLVLDLGYDGQEAVKIMGKIGSTSGQEDSQTVNPFRDYVRSHPPVPIRIDNLRARIEAWRADNPNAVWNDHKAEFEQGMLSLRTPPAKIERGQADESAADVDPNYRSR